jgi:PIN like domain
LTVAWAASKFRGCCTLRLVTLAEHYGTPADESVADVTWLEEAGRQGWAVLMKDERIRRRPAEKAMLVRAALRCFVITRGDLRAEQMAGRFLANIVGMERVCAKPGPFIYAVHQTRLDRLSLD